MEYRTYGFIFSADGMYTTLHVPRNVLLCLKKKGKVQ